MIDAWWKYSGEMGPHPEMMPLDSSFVAEVGGQPALAVALYLTNGPAVYVENFIANHEISREMRREAAQMLVNHFSEFARAKGYKVLVCMTEKQPLADRYEELGFNPALSGVTVLTRSI